MKSLEQCTSIPEAFFEMARAHPEREIYQQAVIDPHHDDRATPRKRSQSTFAEVVERVQGFAQFLRGIGLRKGDKAAIVSQTRPEWMEADLGVLAAGGAVVGVYPSLTATELGYILFDSGARLVIVENQEQLDKIIHLLDHECPMPATEERASMSARVIIERVVCFEDAELPEAHRYMSAGVPRLTRFSEAYDAKGTRTLEPYEAIARGDLASLVYTSGTTGAPKGVIQTHGNHLSNVRQARDSGLFTDDSVLSVFLPLAHSFAKLMGYIGFLTPAGLEFPAVVSKTSSRAEPDSITRDLREGCADIIPTVPRILEKMQAGVERKAHGRGLTGKALSLTLWAANEVYQARKDHREASLLIRMAFAGTAGIRSKIKRQLFGRKFRFAVSGGAKLQTATNEFFDALEIMVLEGYGLTETVVATNINRLDQHKIGTVGPVLAPDIELKIAEDGEICFRGPNVSPGYFNRPVATQQSWDSEGWFHTGDLGALDAEGMLSVTGRKKELIVTSGGKKIPPDPIEQKLKSCKYVGQVLMFGDDKPYCIALICLNMTAVEIWAFQNGKTFSPKGEVDESLRREIWQFVERVNETLASYESIKKIRVLPEEFSLENGLLTPTLKVKRKEVAKRYREIIEEIYTSEREF